MFLNVPSEVADLVWRHRQEVLLANNLQAFTLVVDGVQLATAQLADDPVLPAPASLSTRLR